MKRPYRLCLPAMLFAGLLLLFFGFFSGCTGDMAWPAVLNSIEATYPGVQRVSTDSLAGWLESDSLRQPLLLDVRSEKEFATSHLEGAVRIDPNKEEFSDLDSLARDAPIVLYCSVGYRSSDVASKMQKAGFTNVHNLEGSIFQWANEGRPVYREGARVDVVHPYNAAWGRLLDSDLHPE